MIQNPIVAFDGSEPSLRALRAGLDLASCMKLPLRLITVIEGLPSYITAEACGGADATVIQELSLQQSDYGDRLLAEAQELAKTAGVELVGEAVAGDEIETIVAAVQRHRCDLLIVGLRHHPGLVDRLISRTTQTLTERSPCSVLSVR